MEISVLIASTHSTTLGSSGGLLRDRRGARLRNGEGEVRVRVRVR